MTRATPRTIAGYEIECELARGGMGTVYRARHITLDRPVVLKTLRPELSDDTRSCDRFDREARAAASIEHPNVVAIYDSFVWRGTRYLAQEFVDGTDLASALKHVGRFTPRIAALVALEIARGLEEIHGRAIVHRDLKPSNLLIRRDGAVKIADFGIALDATGPALTETGYAVGTPLYMSPEQLLGERVDPRSDLYSLGTILFEMLSGRVPFASDETVEEPGLIRRIEAGRYPSLRKLGARSPRWLKHQVRECLRAKAKRRPDSAETLRRDLERRLATPDSLQCRNEIATWLWQQRVFALRADETERRPRALPAPRIRRRWATAAATLVTCLLVGTSVWGWIHVEPNSLPRLLALLQVNPDPR